MASSGYNDGSVNWQDLGGPYQITGTTLRVTLNSSPDGKVEAQAIRIQQVPAPGSSKTPQGDLNSSFNRPGVVADGSTFSGGLDGGGSAYSANLLGPTVTSGGITFTLGAAGGNNAVSAAGQTIALAQGSYSTLPSWGRGSTATRPAQAFTVRYTDGSSQAFTQGLSDWYTPQGYAGESVAATTAYRDTASGGRHGPGDERLRLQLRAEPGEVVAAITLPNDANVEILAIAPDVAARAGPAAPSFNRPGVVADGSTFSGGLDGGGSAYSANLLGPTVTSGGITFTLGAAGGNNAVAAAGQTIALAAGSYSTLSFLGAAVNGNQAGQAFIVRYTDGSSQSFTQSLSDWYTPQGYAGESVAAATAYRDTASGGRQALGDGRLRLQLRAGPVEGRRRDHPAQQRQRRDPRHQPQLSGEGQAGGEGDAPGLIVRQQHPDRFPEFGPVRVAPRRPFTNITLVRGRAGRIGVRAPVATASRVDRPGGVADTLPPRRPDPGAPEGCEG